MHKECSRIEKGELGWLDLCWNFSLVASLILKYKEQHYSSLHQWFTFQQATQEYPAKLSKTSSLLAVNYTAELQVCSDGSRQPTPMLIDLQQESTDIWMLNPQFPSCRGRASTEGEPSGSSWQQETELGASTTSNLNNCQCLGTRTA
ncbi:hypothetical protein Peur_067617 [Populus x canadensis]